MIEPIYTLHRGLDVVCAMIETERPEIGDPGEKRLRCFCPRQSSVGWIPAASWLKDHEIACIRGWIVSCPKDTHSRRTKSG